MRADRRSLAVALAFVLGACGASACGNEAGPAGVLVVDAFATPAESSAAIYLTVSSLSAQDAIVGASIVEDPGARVTLHVTRRSDGGMSTMVPVDRIDLPEGRSTLRPGDAHLMAEDLSEPFEIKRRVTLTVTFDRAPDVTVPVRVIDPADALDQLVEERP
jgi:copper(I)-binding protein